MGHKNKKAPLGLAILAVAILVPLGTAVNHLAQSSLGKTELNNLRVDGTPIPPLPPPTGVLVSDGWPIPPLPPATGVLMADGTPIPPLPPPTEQLVADGTPIPPLPPPTRAAEGFTTLVADGTPIPPLPPPTDSAQLASAIA